MDRMVRLALALLGGSRGRSMSRFRSEGRSSAFIPRHQAAVPMGICRRFSGAEFTLLSSFCTTSRTTNVHWLGYVTFVGSETGLAEKDLLSSEPGEAAGPNRLRNSSKEILNVLSHWL